MAVTIPNTATEQVDQSQGLSQAGATWSRSWKDAYATLKTAADAIKTGDAYDSGLVTNVNLRRVPGNYGVLTLTLVKDDTSSGQSPTQTALKAVWTCKSVRNDMSILAYCGGAASRVNLELWMKETDAEVADANSFHKNEAETDQLNSQEINIADKIRKGIDSVVRFYPVLTCTSTWSRIPSSFLQKVGYKDTPGAPSADETHAPGNLSSVISAYDWLKVQDDANETGDGKWQRVESWMGIDGTWDDDLYGASRWTMPIAGDSGGNS